MKITIGRTVLYVLNHEDAEQINRRRTTGSAIADRIKEEKWPLGAQAHIGNMVRGGHVYPAIAVSVWSGVEGSSGNVTEREDPPVNLQVLLDGNDTYWATSRHEDLNKRYDELAAPEQGKWHWPSRV